MRIIFCISIVCVSIFLSHQHALAQQPGGGFEIQPDTVPQYEGELPEAQRARMFAGKPGKAALYSLILPGAGQFYNKRYWKVPIVWGAVGGVTAVVVYNTDQYKTFKHEYRKRLIEEMAGEPPAPGIYEFATTETLRSLRDQANRNRQLSIIILSLTWITQSAEAFVDAHLREFDMSEDISLRFRPVTIDPSSRAMGPGLVVTF